jgi:uncharacterized protein (TIGR00290 family)
MSDRSSVTRLLLSWSSGKDSAWALHVLRASPSSEVCGLLTTVNATHDRVAMHAVRRELLAMQAEAVGLPLRTVELPHPCSNDDYEAALARALAGVAAEGIAGIAFGDLFLADIRAYRERQVSALGLQSVFPLWGRDTSQLAGEMVRSGLRAQLTCVDPRACPREFAGAAFDEDLLRDLPEEVDRCGENGEFHTFAWDGPMFERPVPVRRGPVVERDGFVFADLLPATEGGVP